MHMAMVARQQAVNYVVQHEGNRVIPQPYCMVQPESFYSCNSLQELMKLLQNSLSLFVEMSKLN